jgi:hypothetical protein
VTIGTVGGMTGVTMCGAVPHNRQDPARCVTGSHLAAAMMTAIWLARGRTPAIGWGVAIGYVVLVMVAVAGCGEVRKGAADAAGSDTAADSPAIDGSSDAGPCTTFGGTFTTNAIAFDSDVGTSARVDFETRGDGVTGVTAGTAVPPDEYVACCGLRVEYVGTDTTGQVIWAGNAQGGFSVRATCQAGICNGTAGVRFTFTTPVTAVGAEYAGGTTMALSDAEGAAVAMMSETGSGTNFLGYEAKVRLGRAQLSDGGGEDVSRLLYHRCQ